MPLNLAPAVAEGAILPVIPQSLCTSFVITEQFPMLHTGYHDMTAERSLITDAVPGWDSGNTPRPLRVWKLAKRLTDQQLSDLLAFWQSLNGGQLPFWFYDPLDCGTGAVGSNYDPTGTNWQGRVSCFFRGAWRQVTQLSLHSIPSLEIVEVA